MGHLTIAERVKIVKAYYQNSESIVGTFRALRADYGRHNRPTETTIRNTVKKFENTGSVADVLRSIHKRNARSAEIIAAVSESIEKDPNLSISQRAQHLSVSKSTLWRILHLDLHLLVKEEEPLESSKKEGNSRQKLIVKIKKKRNRLSAEGNDAQKKHKLGRKGDPLEDSL